VVCAFGKSASNADVDCDRKLSNKVPLSLDIVKVMRTAPLSP
jgi:hypothetical protein